MKESTQNGIRGSLIDWARKVLAIAQSGLAFTKDPYDKERYEELQDLTSAMLADTLKLPETNIRELWIHEEGYATPKVDVRGAVFAGDKVLLVRERSDGKWTLPGGWADVNDSPSEAVVREVYEESGYQVRAVKLAAVYDRNRHGHPPALYHIYKLFFLCELEGGAAATSLETDGVGFFALDELPELSTTRVIRSQIERLFAHHGNPDLPTDFD